MSGSDAGIVNDGPGPEEKAVLETAADVLATDGPMPADELVERLGEEGHAMEQGRLKKLLVRPGGPHRLADGRLCNVPAILDGIVLCHHLTAEEAERGQVGAEPDLLGLILVADLGMGIIGGGKLTFSTDGEAVIDGPKGWLRQAQQGDLLAVIVFGHLLSIMIGPDTPEGNPERTGGQLRDTLTELHDLGQTRVELPDLLVEARVRHADLFEQAGPPLVDILPRAGLRYEGQQVLLIEGS